MKFLLMLAVVAFAVWLWRRGQHLSQNQSPQAANTARKSESNPGPQSAPTSTVHPMVQCLHCQVHLPLPEAVRGRLGLYCSVGHREAGADSPPPT